MTTLHLPLFPEQLLRDDSAKHMIPDQNVEAFEPKMHKIHMLAAIQTMNDALGGQMKS